MVSRDELYRLVWSEPMTRIAERFGVSGSYLARVCTLLNVPRPERGYWSKLEVGKAPPQKPLPEAQPGDPLHWSKEGEPVLRPKPKPPVARATAQKVRISRTRVHGLIRDARTHFEHGRPVDEGVYLSRPPPRAGTQLRVRLPEPLRLHSRREPRRNSLDRAGRAPG